MTAIPSGCDDIRDDLDAYALGALDSGDARRVEQHVAACADCRRLLDHARGSAASLALSVPMASAGPSVRARVLAAAESEFGVVGAQPAARAPAHIAAQRSRWWLASAAVLVAALAGVSAWAAVTQRRVDDLERDRSAIRAAATAQAADLASTQAQLADMSAASSRVEAALATQRAMMDVMAQPDVVHVALHGAGPATSASAQYVWSPARDAGVMLADGLPRLDAGQTYQAWVVYETSWESAGTFSVDPSGTGTLLVSGHDEAATAPPAWYCVTIEPAGGSAKHTGPMVLTSLTQ